jgi:IclR family pca regulon transcriptional regulator
MLTPYTIADPAALRAELQRIGAQGWALVDQELEEGLRSIAVPIRGSDRRVIAAMNVSTHTSRHTPSDVAATFLAPLLRTARLIEDDLCSSGALLTRPPP